MLIVRGKIFCGVRLVGRLIVRGKIFCGVRRGVPFMSAMSPALWVSMGGRG